MAQASLPAHLIPDEVLDQIVARADGMPLYLEELTKTLLESAQHRRPLRHLQMAIGAPLAAARGHSHPEFERTYTRARALASQIGESPEQPRQPAPLPARQRAPHLPRSWRCRRSQSPHRSVPPTTSCAIGGLVGEM